MWPVLSVKLVEGNFMKFLQLLTSICLVLFFLTHILAQSKGGRWQFENNGFDSADWDTQSNDGILVGGAAYGNAAPLQEGQFYLFLDTLFQNDYFRVQDNGDLDFTDENIGISAWIYPLELRNDVYFLVNKGRQDSNPKTTNYAIRISNSQHLEFLIRDANNQAQTIASSFTILVNQWNFVAIFYHFASGTVYMWNDPEISPVDTLAFSQSFFANDDPLSIGAWYQNNATTPAVKEFQGRMDDVRISGRMEDILSSYTAIPAVSVPVSREDIFSVKLYPNPVRLDQQKIQVEIKQSIPFNGLINLSIFNLLGQQVYEKTLHSAGQVPSFEWNLQDKTNTAVPAGLYFIRLSDSQKLLIRKIIIIH